VGEITWTWQADCALSGVYPFDAESVALLGYVTVEEEELRGEPVRLVVMWVVLVVLTTTSIFQYSCQPVV
jgi:hypothetical protein